MSGSTSTWVMSNHDVPRHATRYALPQVPTGEYHQIANDWLLRDGTTYIEDRQAGALRARAALMLEMALPGSAYVYQGEAGPVRGGGYSMGPHRGSLRSAHLAGAVHQGP